MSGKHGLLEAGCATKTEVKKITERRECMREGEREAEKEKDR